MSESVSGRQVVGRKPGSGSNIQTDRSGIAQDRSAIRTDAGNIHSDQQDLRADRNDLRSDSQNVRNAGPVQPQRAAGNNGVSAPASVNRNTQLTANTLANNAANNSKNAQTDQTTHKAWYHWIW